MRRRDLLGGFALLPLLAACGQTAPPPKLPEIRFLHRPRLALRVARIDIVETFQPTGAEPYVEHLMVQPPLPVARAWAEDRLGAEGAYGRARLLIKDASVRRESLRKTKGLKGLFTNDQDERFAARLEARLEVEDGRGARGFAQAEASRSRTVAEEISLDQKDRQLFAMIEELGRDFDVQMEKAIRSHLADWLAS